MPMHDDDGEHVSDGTRCVFCDGDAEPGGLPACARCACDLFALGRNEYGRRSCTSTEIADAIVHSTDAIERAIERGVSAIAEALRSKRD
jgi:hypothetical protein